MSWPDQFISQEDIDSQFQSALDDADITFNEWERTGNDCTKRCGCALYEVSDTLAWLFKNREALNLRRSDV
jgi:hypothetical protein